MKEPRCDKCKEEKSRKELGRKINGEYLCKVCKRKLREDRRERLIEEDPKLKEDLREMRNKELREKGYSKKAYEKKIGRQPREYRRKVDGVLPPVPKGNKIKKPKQRSNIYITMQESQIQFRSLVKMGMSGEEAKERIRNLKESQKELREELKKQKVPEEKIKIKQQELIEEMWRF